MILRLILSSADIYGNAESVIGDWFTKTGRRKDIFITSKFGAIDLEQDPTATRLLPNSKPDYMERALRRSLKNLQVESIDLYYQHRVDKDVSLPLNLPRKIC